MPAPNILLGNDAGETAYIDGIVYRRLPEQPQLGIPNKSIQSGDVLDIQPFTWNYDNSNVFEGGNHRTWSGVEVGVSTYIPGNSGVQRGLFGPGTLFTANQSGVIRIWGTTPGVIQFYINGIEVLAIAYTTISKFNARVFRLSQNDILSAHISGHAQYAHGSYAYWQFLPDVYETS